MISEIRPNCANKNTQVFFTWQLEKKNVQSKCFMNERQPNFTGT